MPLYGQSGYGRGKYGIADGGTIYTLTLGYYLALFTSEYRLATNLLTWATALLTPMDDVTNCLAIFTTSFDLDYAAGSQLDTLGVIIGASRRVAFQPTNPADSPVLDDDTYRILLKAAIARNQWDGLPNSLQQIWRALFPTGTITVLDNQNMTADIVVSGSFTTILQDLIRHGLIVPQSETVQYNYLFGDLPILGYDRNDTFVAGYDRGHWA